MVAWPVEQALITALSFVSFSLVVIPLYWHLEAWNVGCVLYIAWIATCSLINFVNGIVWRNTAVIIAPVWGDITTRIIWAEGHGILAASLVINRRLYKIASTTSVSINRAQRRRAIYVDLAIGLGIPLIAMALMWFVQGHRFNIFEGIGPLAAIPNTYFQMVLGNGLCVIIGLVAACYCIGTLRAFMRRRRQFSALLASNNNMNFHRYFRLMALAALELVGTIPLSVWLLVRDTQQPIYVWRGLMDIHLGFSRIEQFPVLVWNSIPGEKTDLTLQQYLTIACGIIFFMFFGLAEEARTHYRVALTSVAKRLGLSTGAVSTSAGWSPSKGSKLGVSIPSFVQRSFVTAPTASHPNGRSTRKHDSFGFDSFSDRLSTHLSVGDFGDFEDKQPYSPADTTAGGSSTSVSTPVDGNEEKTHQPLVRPDSGVVVVNVEVITDRRSVDVPSSVRDESHMV